MKLNHLAICARDVAASQDFYCKYFGFRVSKTIAVPSGAMAGRVYGVLAARRGALPLTAWREDR